MEQDYLESDRETEEKRQLQRQRRREEMRRKKQQQMRIRKACRIGIPALFVLIVAIGIAVTLHKPKQPGQNRRSPDRWQMIARRSGWRKLRIRRAEKI